MKLQVSRRSLFASALASPLATSACSFSPIVPNATMTQLDPVKPISLHRNHAIVTGLVFYAERGVPPVPAAISRRVDRALVFTAADHQRFAIPFLTSHESSERISMDGVDLWVRPFAVVVTAGKLTTNGIAFTGYTQDFVDHFSTYNRTEVIMKKTLMISKASRMSFAIIPEEIAYIGQFGVFHHYEDFRSEEERDQACPQVGRLGRIFGRASPFSCSFTETVVGSDPTRDIARIQARFQNLAGARFRVAPGEQVSIGGRAWPAALAEPIPTDPFSYAAPYE